MPVFRIVYRPVFDINQLDPRTHIVREAIILEEGATLLIGNDATVWIVDGNPESFMNVPENVTITFN
jgi:hypothetical protein